MNKKQISLILGIMCFLLTYGISIQVKTIKSTGTTISTNEKEAQLKEEILKLKEKYNNIYEELDEAEKILEKERITSTENNEELENLENSITEGNKLLGLTEVTGTGIIITLKDNTSWTNYLGDSNNLLVHYYDLTEMVNELKNAGAEAISVNEQRIVTTTAIECDGNVIKINGVKVGAPFEIKAIGFPEQLSGAITRTGSYANILQEDYGIGVSLAKPEKITIPKYAGAIKFNYATTK